MTKTYRDLTPGKLQQWLEENPQADVKQVKEIKRRIRLAKEEENE